MHQQIAVQKNAGVQMAMSTVCPVKGRDAFTEVSMEMRRRPSVGEFDSENATKLLLFALRFLIP